MSTLTQRLLKLGATLVRQPDFSHQNQLLHWHSQSSPVTVSLPPRPPQICRKSWSHHLLFLSCFNSFLALCFLLGLTVAWPPRPSSRSSLSHVRSQVTITQGGRPLAAGVMWPWPFPSHDTLLSAPPLTASHQAGTRRRVSGVSRRRHSTEVHTGKTRNSGRGRWRRLERRCFRSTKGVCLMWVELGEKVWGNRRFDVSLSLFFFFLSAISHVRAPAAHGGNQYETVDSPAATLLNKKSCRNMTRSLFPLLVARLGHEASLVLHPDSKTFV